MKFLKVHLDVLKLFSYYLMLTFSLMTIALIIGFCTHTFFFDLVLKPPQQPSIPNTRVTISASRGYLVQPNYESRWITSDDELMRKASMVQQTVSTQKPKIAFLFMIKGSIPLAPLWEKFFKGHEEFFSIYVHSDSSAYNYFPHLETGVFRGRMIPSKEVKWAKFSMVEAEIRLISNALLDTSNQRFVLLSESCIPLFNFSTIYSYLMNSTETYIEAYDLPGQVGRGRYKAGLWPNITIQQWRKGSQWFEIDRDLAIKVISDNGYFNLFRGVCRASRTSCCADEHYLPTWVNMHHGSTNANRTLTWTNWFGQKCHPAKYQRMDISSEFLKRIRSNQTCLYNSRSTNICYLFARKFAPSSLDRLLRFAPKVMEF